MADSISIYSRITITDTMIVETEEKDVRHPEGKILLKNGNVLDCYEKEDRPVAIKPDIVGLDTSREFLWTKAK